MSACGSLEGNRSFLLTCALPSLPCKRRAVALSGWRPVLPGPLLRLLAMRGVGSGAASAAYMPWFIQHPGVTGRVLPICLTAWMAGTGEHEEPVHHAAGALSGFRLFYGSGLPCWRPAAVLLRIYMNQMEKL